MEIGKTLQKLKSTIEVNHGKIKSPNLINKKAKRIT